MRRRVSVGIRLKIDDEFIGLVAVAGTLHALYHLLANGWRVTRYRWRKRIDIAISAAAVAFGAIAVGAGKAAINNYFKYPLALVFIAQPGAIIVIALFPLCNRCICNLHLRQR